MDPRTLDRLPALLGLLPPSDDPIASRRLRWSVGLAGLAMLGLSSKVWVFQEAIPAVPFFDVLPYLGRGPSWLLAAVGVASLAGAAAGWGARLSGGIFLVAMVLATLQDQNRFQPWAWHLMLATVALALVGGRQGIALLRALTIGIYFWSGVQKLNADFVAGPGAILLEPFARIAGAEAGELPGALVAALTLGMGAAETSLAPLLAFRRTRRAGVAAAVVMHAAILYALGPLGHDWNRTVWPWNLLMIAQVLLLFGRTDSRGPVAPVAGATVTPLRGLAAAYLLFGLALVLPALKLAGLYDHYPSFALYTTWGETTEIDLRLDATHRLPPSLRDHLGPPWADAEGVPWRQLLVVRWTERELGVPPYAQHRVGVATARALCERFALDDGIAVRLEDRPGLLAAEGPSRLLAGCEDVRAEAERFRLGSRPAPAFQAGRGDAAFFVLDPPPRWNATMVRAWRHVRAGRFDEAEPAWREAAASAEHPAGRARALVLLGRTLRRLGRAAEALSALAGAEAIYEAGVPGHPSRDAVALERADLLETSGDVLGAEAALAAVVARREAALGERHQGAAEARMRQAAFFLRRGRTSEAGSAFGSCLDVFLEADPTHPRVVDALNGLAIALLEEGRVAEAKERYAAALAVVQGSLPQDDPLCLTLRREHAAFLDAAARVAPEGTGGPSSGL